MTIERHFTRFLTIKHTPGLKIAFTIVHYCVSSAEETCLQDWLTKITLKEWFLVIDNSWCVVNKGLYEHCYNKHPFSGGWNDSVLAHQISSKCTMD